MLKLSLGHSGREVWVLDLAWWPDMAYCLLHKREVDAAAIDARLAGQRFIIEEAVPSGAEPIPKDFKFYVRQGRTRIVTVIDRNGPMPALSFVACATWRTVPPEQIYVRGLPKQWRDGGLVDDGDVARARTAAAFAEGVVRSTRPDDLFVGIDTYVPAETPATASLGEITPRMGAIHAPRIRPAFLRTLLID